MTNENQFLNLLAKDIDENPNELKTINSDLVIHVKYLTEDIADVSPSWEVDLEEILLDD